MPQDPVDRPRALAAVPLSGARVGAGDPSMTLPGVAAVRTRLRLPRLSVRAQSVAGRAALGTLILGTFAVVAFTTSHASVLVPRSYQIFPNWDPGLLHGLLGRLPNNPLALKIGFSSVTLVMLLAYGLVLASVRQLSMRTIAWSVVALNVILLLSPPQQLNDVWNYLGYARLGALHHLNPYTHVIAQEIHDPVYRFTTWHNLHSPYGPLFTAISYPIAHLPLPVAYWTYKIVTVLLSLTFVALVWRCATQLGRDPRFAVLFVAANPIYLMYAVAGFHNDFFMLVPSTAAIALLLARRDRAAGAVLMVAVAVKFSAVLLLPFLLVAVRTNRRRRDVLVGAALGTVPLAALSVALFGFSLPNLVDQSTLLTGFSIPNVVGALLGVGGATVVVLRIAKVAVVVAVALLLRRSRDWLAGAGWATIALIASLAWFMPWYVVWVLPLAALGSSLPLRRVAAGLTVYLVLVFIPTTGILLGLANFNPMDNPAGHASIKLQMKLER